MAILRANGVLSDRLNLAQQYGLLTFGNKRRDVYAAAGYDKSIRFEQYLACFQRQDIAQRIVSAPVVEAWRYPPTLLDGIDTAEGAEGTPFTNAWLRLVNSARDDAETRPGIVHPLTRLDLVSRIGRYAVLFFGLNDGKAPEEPAEANSLRDISDLLFVSVYDEGSARIVGWETDRTSPRYGKPTLYELVSIESGQQTTLRAHWTRCLHVADGVLTNDLFGTPALEPVWNRLIDIQKIMAATGEAGWTVMQPGYIFSTRDGYELSDDGAEQRQEQIDEFVHGLRRFLEVNGYEATTLSSQLQDPTGAITNALRLISAATGIPLRKLTGSERGELASTQDDENWIDFIEARQRQHLAPVIIEPFVNRLLWLGVLPPPSSGAYTVWWPSLRKNDPHRQAQIADISAQALQKIGATVDPRAFVAAYMPDLPVDAVSASPRLDAAKGGGLADNAAHPFWRGYP
jgi:hypothetical protein